MIREPRAPKGGECRIPSALTTLFFHTATYPHITYAHTLMTLLHALSPQGMFQQLAKHDHIQT
jgi:hypothetical protein